MRLSDLLANYRPGSYDQPWSWHDETQELIGREPTYLASIASSIVREGFHAPIQLHHGERRVWDGHHRVVAAIVIGLDEVPTADARYSDSDQLVER